MTISVIPCPGIGHLYALCPNEAMPGRLYCQRCEQERLAQLQASRTPQERGCEVRWGFGSEGEML